MQKQSVPYFIVASAFIIIDLPLQHSRNEKDKKKKSACLKIINNYTVTTQTVRKYARTI